MATQVASSAPSMRAAGSISINNNRVPPSAVAIPTHNANAVSKNQYLGLEAFSPVNQNGSFEFDRVLMSGDVNKRSRKTKQWKRFYLVLRPNVLSVYKNQSEAKLLKQLHLHEITATAVLKDPKGRRSHMFGVFSPSRNFHFQASSDASAKAWVELIKREARLEEEDVSTVFGSPQPDAPAHESMDQYILSGDEGEYLYDRGVSSSPEPMDVPSSYTTTRDGVKIPALRQGSQDQSNLDYSGPEQGSFSDFSDAGPSRIRKSAQISRDPELPKSHPSVIDPQASLEAQPRPSIGRNASTMSARVASGTAEDEERTLYHGWLLVLKSKGGVRQWKRLWTVLRPKNITLYKSEDEYAAQLILPISSILSAVEIDPISKTKSNCMQIIAEERSYRFSAPSEEALARWLGALQSQLAKRKQRRAARENEI